jgi:hypothetical protein
MRCKPVLVFLMIIYGLQCHAQESVKEILHEKIPVEYTGKPIDAYEFKDAGGLHIYLISKLEDSTRITIFGYGYTLVNGHFILDWKITDCSGDNVLLSYPYTKIVDIDNDGLMESIFVYQLDPNDGMGSTYKVMLHYKNKKYVLRVHIPQLDEDEYIETYDKSFDTLPRSIKKYIAAYWNNVAKHEHIRGTEWYEIPKNLEKEGIGAR